MAWKLPTRSTPVTQRGTIVGTFQYMSPEQVEGKDVDARTDIFSFGSVLYEMVTGCRAFPGKSQLGVASAILEKDPEPITTLQPLTPRALDHTVRRCLAKDAEERWQTARDVKLELQWIAEAGSQAGVPDPIVSQRKMRESLAWLAAALGIVLAVMAAVGWWRSARSAPQHLPMRLSADLPPGAGIDRFRGAQLAISPDGTRIVVAESDTGGRWHLVMRWLDQSQFAPLSGADRASQPFFSPDGQWMGFFAGGKLKKMPVQGGAPVTLCDAPGFHRGASWGDDGNIVAALNEGASGLVRVSSGGGTPTSLTQLIKEKGETAHGWPQVLPGSQAVLFTAYGTGSPDDAEIAVISFKTGERKTIRRGGFFGRYLPSKHLVYLRQNTLFAQPFDLSRLTVTGDPQPVLEEVNNNVSAGGDFDFSQTGTLVYVVSSNARISFRTVWWLDSTGQTKPLHVAQGIIEGPRFSPDGKRLAFELATGAAQADIWVKDLERDTVSRLTHLPGRNGWPLWTPDGKSIVFASSRQEAPGMYWIRADGSGEAQRLTGGETRGVACSFSPDGKRLAYFQWNADGNTQIWTVPVEGDSDHPRLGKPEAFLRTSFSESYPVFSPDGHWLAYSSNESGAYELYVRPFPGPGGKSQISTGGGYPIWSRNGRQLFFLSSDWRIMVAEYTARGDSFTAGKPQVWSQKNLVWGGGNYTYDLAPDGKRFAVFLNPEGDPGIERAQEKGQKPTDSVMVLLNKVASGKN
jgi:Tol biopolymer transport system component